MEACRLNRIENDGHVLSEKDTILRLGLYKCPSCGAEIEIFSDEHQVKCYQCHETIYHDMISPCIEWRTLAGECLGRERWKRVRDRI